MQKTNILLYASSILLLALGIITSNNVLAQNEKGKSGLPKYELSIDLVPIIDDGEFGKVYLKFKQYEAETEKGAFRIGISKATGSFSKYDKSSIPENVDLVPIKSRSLNMEAFAGYERYKYIEPVIAYYGIDLKGRFYLQKSDYTDDYKITTIALCPFVGVKHFVYENRISLAFEVGWENGIGFLNHLHPTEKWMKNTNIYSSISLPYSFTLNYHF